jgi:predicted Rossmann-fold nucleotide-binding protein
MRVEVTTLDALRAHREAGGDLRRALLIGLDLTSPEADALLRGTPLDEALLLGCRLLPAARERAEASGALVFPAIPDLPYEAYRTSLYTTDELFAGFDPRRPESYRNTLDARVYRHAAKVGVARPDPLHALAERLHDHSITAALDDVLEAAALEGRAAPVAVMGGHALRRNGDGYRQAAELGRALGRSAARFTVLTGGGPGAMEAVPLGVRFAGQPDDALPAALAELSRAPIFEGDRPDDHDAIGSWLAAAWSVASTTRTAGLARTIGIPTWFYGHEPPNLFCDAHAKYFANSVREDGLLTVACGGVVYTPGSAGTVQEIFADYAQNHYASVGPAAPMIFLDAHYWTSEVPAAPLVQQLAKGRDAEPWIMVTDDVDEVVGLLEAYASR